MSLELMLATAKYMPEDLLLSLLSESLETYKKNRNDSNREKFSCYLNLFMAK